LACVAALRDWDRAYVIGASARLHSGIADLTRRSKEAPAFAAVSAVVTDDTDEARRAT
jgi:hypothetical protein